jgi:hypothetical protein
VTTSQPGSPPPGFPARHPTPGLALALSVDVPNGPSGPTGIFVQLKGDLTGVAASIPAAAWVDQQIAGEWRSVYWFANMPGGGTSSGTVDGPVGQVGDPTVKALMVPAAAEVDFITAGDLMGDYRICRVVPFATKGQSSPSSSANAYVCTRMVIDRTLPAADITTTN